MEQAIKTFDDVLQALGITADEFEKSTVNDTVDEKGYKKLKLVARALNGEWKADFSDDDQMKYYPYFYYTAGSGLSFNVYDFVRSTTRVASRLCFKSRLLAEYAGKQFIEIYKEYIL